MVKNEEETEQRGKGQQVKGGHWYFCNSKYSNSRNVYKYLLQTLVLLLLRLNVNSNSNKA